MLIIIEGTDGAGKTTLANKLLDVLRTELPDDDVEYLHYAQPQRHPLAEYELDLQDYRPGCGRHLVIDRYHLGELVYAEVYRGGSELGAAGRLHIDAFLAARGALLVLCNATVAQIAARLEARGDETYLQPEHQGEVLRRFREVAAAAQALEPVVLDGFADRDDIERLFTLAHLLDYDARTVNDFPSYIGSPYPRVLLLGDRGYEHMGKQHTAAFVPYPDTSGYWLLDALCRWSSLDLREVGIANTGEDDVHALWTALHKPLVVSLGIDAADACAVAGVPCSVIAHPQLARRFNLWQTREYVRDLERAVEKQVIDLRKWMV
jgi:thymidylate kinase